MKFVFVSYINTPQYKQPEAWLKRTNAFGGILEALAKTDTVISIEQIDYEGELYHNSVQYYFKRFSKTALLFPFKLHSFIRSQQPDVIVVGGLHFPFQVIQLQMMLSRRTKIILQNHAEKPNNRVRKYLQRLADGNVDAYFFASKDMGLHWVSNGNLASAQKIYEVMEVSSVFQEADKQQARALTGISAEPAFLWVGRLNDNKDPLTVVQAFLSFAMLQPSAHLYMIYQEDDLLNEIKQLLSAHPEGNHVHLVGRVPHAELADWFNSADFIISGSHFEGSGAAVCEAMSCGCIPVVTNIDSFRAITDQGKCGLLYEPGNVEELLLKLLSTKNLNIAAMRQEVLKYYHATLSFDAIAGRFHSIAESLSR